MGEMADLDIDNLMTYDDELNQDQRRDDPMNVAQALSNAGASGFLLEAVTVREAGNRIQEDSKFKAGMKNWKQKIRVADSTGDTDVYLTDQPLVKVGDTIEIQGASTAKSGKYLSANYKAVVKSVGAIQRGPEPATAMAAQTRVSFAPDKSVDVTPIDPLGNMERLLEKCIASAEKVLRARYVPLDELPAGTVESEARLQVATNERVLQVSVSFFIGMSQRR